MSVCSLCGRRRRRSPVRKELAVVGIKDAKEEFTGKGPFHGRFGGIVGSVFDLWSGNHSGWMTCNAMQLLRLIYS